MQAPRRWSWSLPSSLPVQPHCQALINIKRQGFPLCFLAVRGAAQLPSAHGESVIRGVWGLFPFSAIPGQASSVSGRVRVSL